jgi:hypothetical protein
MFFYFIHITYHHFIHITYHHQMDSIDNWVIIVYIVSLYCARSNLLAGGVCCCRLKAQRLKDRVTLNRTVVGEVSGDAVRLCRLTNAFRIEGSLSLLSRGPYQYLIDINVIWRLYCV